MDDGDADGGGDGAARRHVREAGCRERLASPSVDGGGGGEPVVDVELDAVHDGNGEQAGGKAAVKTSGAALLPVAGCD